MYFYEIRGIKILQIYFYYFKFHVFTLQSSGEYRCYTNSYWWYTYNTTVIDHAILSYYAIVCIIEMY